MSEPVCGDGRDLAEEELAKIRKGADELCARLLGAMKGPSGEVHPQSALCALGSCAGYSCQKDVRDIYMKQRGLAEDLVFNIVSDKQGRHYFFGDLLNAPLVNDRYSLWSMVGGAVRQRGGTLPDINDIFRYISYTVGGEQFGKVRSCRTGDSMETYLENLWQPLSRIAAEYAPEGALHTIFGTALQKLVYAFASSMNVTEAARIAMESAVSMSKVRLGR
ncbi:MAG: hypothetical protein IJ806_11850 [Ruminococcus sp.]|nr:hypothetical protein [Ruminococcus sp.]